jgi:hypothetical protein
MLVKIGKYNGNRNSGSIYTRVILTEIYHLSGMKSFRDDLIDRMKTGWGRFVLASDGRGIDHGAMIFSMTEYERFGLVFTKTRVYKYGHCCLGRGCLAARHC